MNIWNCIVSAYGVTAFFLFAMVIVTYWQSKKVKR